MAEHPLPGGAATAPPSGSAAPAPNGGRRSSLADMGKEAGLAAFVALMLALPMGGFKTTEATTGLSLAFRPLFVIVAVAFVFVGRIVLIVLRERRGAVPRGDAGPGLMDRIARGASENTTRIGAVILVVAVLLPFMPFSSRYLIDTATTVLIYVMLGWGLNIVVGLAGLLDLGYVAFYAVGAYSYALLATEFGWSFWVCLPLAGVLAAMAGVLLGFPVLRLRGDYLAIVTLGFGEIIRLILLNWYEVTNGPDGISRIPRPTFFGLEFTRRPTEDVMAFHQYFDISYSGEHRVIFLYFLILVLALITNVFTQRIRRLPVGRGWEALREDEIACRSLGINPTNTKLTAFGLGALFGGFAGAFFATRQGFISPESFTFIESAIILAIVVLGGMGSQLGVVLAATLLIVLPELGRELAQFRMLVFGAAMVGIMVWRPRGLLAHREPTLLLYGKERGLPPHGVSGGAT